MLYRQHVEEVGKKQKEQAEALRKENDQIEYLTKSIREMQRCNQETMVQIRNDANLEIKEMQMKN